METNEVYIEYYMNIIKNSLQNNIQVIFDNSYFTFISDSEIKNDNFSKNKDYSINRNTYKSNSIFSKNQKSEIKYIDVSIDKKENFLIKNSLINAVFLYLEENFNLLFNLMLNFNNLTFKSFSNKKSKKIFVEYISFIAYYFTEYLKGNFQNLKNVKKIIMIVYELCKKCIEFKSDFQNNLILKFLEEYTLEKYGIQIEILINNMMNSKGIIITDFDGGISK
jgi:hypothetical protein